MDVHPSLYHNTYTHIRYHTHTYITHTHHHTHTHTSITVGSTIQNIFHSERKEETTYTTHTQNKNTNTNTHETKHSFLIISKTKSTPNHYGASSSQDVTAQGQTSSSDEDVACFIDPATTATGQTGSIDKATSALLGLGNGHSFRQGDPSYDVNLMSWEEVSEFVEQNANPRQLVLAHVAHAEATNYNDLLPEVVENNVRALHRMANTQYANEDDDVGVLYHKGFW